MPILAVHSHHDSPESSSNLFKGDYPLKSPSNKVYIQREQEGALASGIIIPTTDALEKLLISPQDNFSGYRYSRESQSLSPRFIGDDSRDFSEKLGDYDDPSRQHFGKTKMEGVSGIGLITSGSQYADCMRALLEVMSDLPIVPVLQAELFDPKMLDSFRANNFGLELNKSRFPEVYPYGVLAHSKRIWPEFYHAHTGEPLLRVSHHPHKDNDPHYNAFHGDPRLGEIEDGDDLQTIIGKLKTSLMPIINEQIETVNEAHSKTKEVEKA